MKKIMIVVGHSLKEKGCSTTIDKIEVTERDLCLDVATLLFSDNKSENLDIVLKARNVSYKNLPQEINSYNPDYIIELHLNSSTDKSIQGSEHLYYYGSRRSEKMAEILQKHCVEELGYRNRGIKPIKEGDRGYNILYNTKAPCVIAEPFFLSEIKGETLLMELLGKYVTYIERALKEIVEKNI